MARIRIVDAWRRCPAAPLTHQRAIMVMAEAWAEQRVLMRAYAESPDQTRPTIVLHGAQHAIGPAGPDPHGPWGIHVQPPADGRAQALRRELELAARRMAGSKGNPPRLLDEEPSFDRKRTNHWAPGTPRDLPHAPGQPASEAAPTYYEPNQPHGAAPPPGPAAPAPAQPVQPVQPAQPVQPVQPAQPVQPVQPVQPAQPVQPVQDDGRDSPGRSSTVLGFARAAAADPPPAALERSARRAPGRRFGSLVGRTMPLGLRLTAQEHAVLDALGEARMLPASRIAEIAGAADGAAWMAAFIAKLAGCGLDLIVTTRDGRGEPIYALRG